MSSTSPRRAGEIDAGDHRKAAHHRRLAGDGEPVLVVDGRMAHPHQDIALHQGVGSEVLQGDALACIGLLDEDGLELHSLLLKMMRPQFNNVVVRPCPTNGYPLSGLDHQRGADRSSRNRARDRRQIVVPSQRGQRRADAIANERYPIRRCLSAYKRCGGRSRSCAADSAPSSGGRSSHDNSRRPRHWRGRCRP